VSEFDLPRVPASAGALLSDGEGRILVVKPTYKAGWTIPGGQMEADGESPWEACRREVHEEVGLVLARGRLVCVDFLRPKTNRPGGVRFLFDCGEVAPERRGGLVLQEGELEAYRWATPEEAADLLSGPVGRRVAAALAVLEALGGAAFVYLEDGRPVPEVPA
jgi:8-oxo-dGTP diphosphatase